MDVLPEALAPANSLWQTLVVEVYWYLYYHFLLNQLSWDQVVGGLANITQLCCHIYETLMLFLDPSIVFPKLATKGWIENSCFKRKTSY